MVVFAAGFRFVCWVRIFGEVRVCRYRKLLICVILCGVVQMGMRQFCFWDSCILVLCPGGGVRQVLYLVFWAAWAWWFFQKTSMEHALYLRYPVREMPWALYNKIFLLKLFFFHNNQWHHIMQITKFLCIFKLEKHLKPYK